ncbi:MAG: hypothetical protein ATN36_06795 [Epulopiscium sp. Nele67-Bin005]|nr:MAG: hypothetical protein ATN36_06795 [Epulopiscium sp. Nele67-Bin005]
MNKRSFLLGLLGSSLLFSSPEKIRAEEIHTFNGTVSVNSTILDLKSTPLMKDDRSYYPFREILEELDYNISYSLDTRTITAIKGDEKLEFIAGNTSFKLNGQTHQFTTGTPFIHTDDLTYIPIRDIFESLGYEVGYTLATQTITLDTVGEPLPPAIVLDEAEELPPSISIDKDEEQIKQFTQEVLDLVNAERKKAGLSELKSIDTLSEVAQLRAEELHEVFSHTRPDGSTCFTALDEAKMFMSSLLSVSVTSVSVAGRPHWRSYRRSTRKLTSCCTEPTHCDRN